MAKPKSESPVFRRKIYGQMLEWKKREGRTALLIDGARRVGKTTVVEEFARKEYRSHIILDFSDEDDYIRGLFKNVKQDPDRFFRLLQEYTDTTLYERESVIVFDEVQLFPLARQMIKHLVKDGRYDYIETGSLISIKKNVKNILIPSEETSIRMHPMDFEEFLWAQNREGTIDTIRRAFEAREPLGFENHRRIMDMYTTYMLVGGMPQAVETFVRMNNFEAVEGIKRDILELYSNDAVKINSRAILVNVPSFLSKHDKKFTPGTIREGSRTSDFEQAVDWLRESRMVNMCVRVSDPGPAPDLTSDETTFKLYMLDTGLLVTAAFKKNVAKRKKLYEDLLSGKLNVNKGMFFENMVAQELVMNGHELAYCKFSCDESDKLQEVDFVIADGDKVIPVESKSGRSSEHASLDRFMVKYSDWVDRAFVVHSKDLRVDGNITYIPIYMAMFL